MKKLALVLSSLLVVTSIASAKEYVAKPERSKEIVAEPVVVEEVVTVAPVVEAAPVVTPESYLTLRVGGDITPRYKEAFGWNGRDGKNFGGEVALEYMREIMNSGFELGLGAAYQRHAGVDNKADYSVGRFDSVPLYTTAKYVFGDWNGWKPYAKADLGYSFNNGQGNFPDGASVKDGMYWGAGLGTEYNNWTLDAMYKVNNAKLDTDNMGSEKFDYSRVTVSAGYKFDI